MRHPSEQSAAELHETIARLQEQVWWLGLPLWRRWLYVLFGHRLPHRDTMCCGDSPAWLSEFVQGDVKPLMRRLCGRA